MKEKTAKKSKKFNWVRFAQTWLRIGSILALITLLVGGWATERQEAFNEQNFWSPNRTTNAFGVLFLILGWGFWEFFIILKNRSIKLFICSIIALVTSVILINGIVGLIGGIIGLGCLITSYLLDYYKIVPISKRTN